MAIKEKDKKARANYKKKITEIRVELYGTDEDIKSHLQKIVDSGETKAAYVKRLIREDMSKTTLSN
jgi:predicted transcriptional regulator